MSVKKFMRADLLFVASHAIICIIIWSTILAKSSKKTLEDGQGKKEDAMSKFGPMGGVLLGFGFLYVAVCAGLFLKYDVTFVKKVAKTIVDASVTAGNAASTGVMDATKQGLRHP